MLDTMQEKWTTCANIKLETMVEEGRMGKTTNEMGHQETCRLDLETTCPKQRHPERNWRDLHLQMNRRRSRREEEPMTRPFSLTEL